MKFGHFRRNFGQGEEMAHARLWAAIDRKIFAPLLRLDAEEQPGEGPAPPAGAAQPPPASGGAAAAAETPAASAAAIFAEIDADHSGALSFEEFRRWWSDRQAATTGRVDEAVLAKGEELFAQKDADGNGVLSLVEFSAVLSALAGDEWAEAVDPSSGKMYWYSRTTKVIPTPSHLLDRISPISSPFFPVFCAFSPSRRGGSNEPQAGAQGQETVAR
eukprot:COSAG04_NODE_4191_length_2243_cov_16.271922_4_plen_216_part_01